ncbi:autotransporter outer membrane beta-barrel domain-containing protein [Francisellaceae bacterium]|nr:autotransporter outer membrane beta-barrel domain-containing protein [Francisellaceae bacterium]
MLDDIPAGINLNVGSANVASYNMGVGINYEWMIALAEDKALTPNVFLGYTVDLLNQAVSSTVQFQGGGASFETTGITPDRNNFLLNAGLLYEVAENIKIRLDYNLVVKDQFISSAVALKGRYLF